MLPWEYILHSNIRDTVLYQKKRKKKQTIIYLLNKYLLHVLYGPTTMKNSGRTKMGKKESLPTCTLESNRIERTNRLTRNSKKEL